MSAARPIARTAVVVTGAVTVATGLLAASAMSATASSAGDRAVPSRVFSAASPFVQRLPASTPTATDSAALVADLVQQSKDHFGSWDRRNVDISVSRYAPTMYVAHHSDPVVTFRTENCQGKGPGWDADLLKNDLSGIHIPADAVPDRSSDGAMVIYNPDDDTVTETWVTKKIDANTWSACWGGTIRNASTQLGQHRSFYGVSASGLSQAGYVIRPEELARGHIDHVVALSIPKVKAMTVSWPAVRSDGREWGQALAEGQMLRLPADLDIDAMRLSPAARTIAKAAQEYGILITDQGGAVSFAAQNLDSYDTNPYDAIFRGRWGSQEMDGDRSRGEEPFPLDKLQALPVSYRVEGAPAPAPAPNTSFQILQSATPGIVTTPLGRWAARADSTFDSTRTSSRRPGVATSGTAEQDIYAQTTWGQKHYGVDLPNGSYTVTLYQSEDYWDGPGRRIFDVLAQGRTVLKDVDVYARTGGKYRADEPSFPVEVTNGHLDIDWLVKRDNALVNGIRITKR